MTRQPVPAAIGALALIAAGIVLLMLGAASQPSGPQRRSQPEPVYLSRASGQAGPVARAMVDMAAAGISGPDTMMVAPASFEGDVRQLPPIASAAMSPELDAAENEHSAGAAVNDPVIQSAKSASPPSLNMPSPIQNFAGLDYNTWGTGYPPDTNGDAGPNDYVETVNTSIGIFSKTAAIHLRAALTFNTLFTGAGTGTPCDNSNRGDPVALYDARADRFIVADFAWANLNGGPYYECIAASKTGDPVLGGWWMYALRADDDAHRWLNDYPKLAVWPDGIYMSANMYQCANNCASALLEGVRVWAINRDDLYRGAALRVVRFDTGPDYGTLLPSNYRAAAAPARPVTAAHFVYLPAIFSGASIPNYFVSNDRNFYALDVFKFHVDWANPANSTFTGPSLVTQAIYNFPSTVPELSANSLDSLGTRLMVQNQYSKLNGSESLWLAHTADNAPTGVRWYQVNITGGTVAQAPVQQGTYRPDGSYRWMPSLAVDKFGNMAIGYSVSSGSQHPDIRYAGRLASDPLGMLSQGETTLIAGTGGQTNSCGGFTCHRWGDYSGMTLDPLDNCTFWYANEYYAASGGDWQTRIGSFRFPACGS